MTKFDARPEAGGLIKVFWMFVDNPKGAVIESVPLT